VQIVSECVAILRGLKEISWKAAKGMMSDPAFLRYLQEMDCDHITLKQQQAVRAHLKKSDKLDQMQAISRAGYGLYKFVIAVLDYCAVYREVPENFITSRYRFIYEIYHASNLRKKYYKLSCRRDLRYKFT